MRHYFVPLTGFLLSLLLQGLVTNAAWALMEAIPNDDSIAFDLQATVFNRSGSCREDVHLEGTAKVVTDVRQQKSGLAEITVFLTLDMHGVGALTGARYLATGAVQKEVVTQALPSSVQVKADFDLLPLGACRLPRQQVEHLSMRFELAFDATGSHVSFVWAPIFAD
jgi:hypothetical protein